MKTTLISKKSGDIVLIDFKIKKQVLLKVTIDK